MLSSLQQASPSSAFVANAKNHPLNYNVFNELFSLESIIEFFGFNENEIFFLRIQEFLVQETSDIIKNLEVFNLFSSQNNDIFSIFNDCSFFSVSDLQSSNLFQINKTLLKNIETAGIDCVENTTGLRAVYPNFYDLITDYELATVEDDGSMIDALSTPDTKLHYPEPFVASPSFVHEDLWFIHILHYQHWLWFMFISLIMFYFITFINVVRWCNLRTKPRRETRGVSRSKCADLITACVPVTWAASIIISETVDAADYYDGFGSGEIVIGIRAYQWGWEYFYPKGIDLNYNVNPSYSSMVGNSLKYTTTNSNALKSNTLWKYYQNQNNNKTTSTPAHLILAPSDSDKVLNFMKFSDMGVDNLKDSTTFKKIQYFSKSNPQKLYSNVDEFNLKYKKLSDLYLSDYETASTPNYGIKRQHNYVSRQSLLNNSNTFMDSKSLNTFMSYNHGTSAESKNTPLTNSLKFHNHSPALGATTSSNSLNKKLNSTNQSTQGLSLANYLSFLDKTTLISAETDSAQTSNPLKYALNNKWNKKNFINAKWANTLLLEDEITGTSPTSNFSTKLLNEEVSPRFKDLKSAGTSFLPSERNTRLVNNLSGSKSILNYGSADNNLNTLVATSHLSSPSTLQEALFTGANTQWVSTNSLSRLLNNTTSSPMSHTPIQTSGASNYALAFDKFLKNEDDLTPNLLKSKEESAPNHIFNTYWLTHWASSNSTHRYTNLFDLNQYFDTAYLPTFHEYAEYDFKNWQALELLEDAFWESTYSAFSHEDYLNILQSAKDHTYFKKQEELFNLSNRHKKFKAGLLSKPSFKDLTAQSTTNSLPIFSEESVIDPSLLNLSSFFNFSNETTVDSLEDSYESFKYINYIYHLNYTSLSQSNSSAMHPLSYTQIIDNFRADYEDNSWYSSVDTSHDKDYNTSALSTDSDLRVTNTMKLRSSARSAIVTYNAIQKVFKSRFDEGRSNARLQDFSNSYVSHPFITEKKSPYESMLAKNTDSFFNVNSYKNSLVSNFNQNTAIWNSLNTYFVDVPFLLSMKSDPSRYLWFDWQSRWSSLEVQPSSTARYSLLGLPYTSKSFEYSTGAGDEINDSENYLIKLARARKNYLSSWARTPYFYSRVSNWYQTPKQLQTLYTHNSISNLKTSLFNARNYWSSVQYVGFTTSQSTPTLSGVNTPLRSSWRPSTSIQSYYYNASILTDLLSKREYIYRQYFTQKGLTTAIPKYFTAAPNNPLLEEVKAAYPLIDPTSFSSETSRDLFYSNTNFIKFIVLKDILNLTNSKIQNSSINLSSINNYLFFYLFNTDNNSSDLGNNKTLFKSQFRPMKKGVTNMIRLHATSAIAMPIEIRLHILASSKDIIHSWSIPSAGIKIDCVPGYSSHRIAIFLVTGIFWGQCMEICGRFHHWMPIIVYFMKRDLFFLWCTHFMHYSSLENTFNMTDRQFTDHVKLVSYDKSTWVHEFTKSF